MRENRKNNAGEINPSVPAAQDLKAKEIEKAKTTEERNLPPCVAISLLDSPKT